MRRGKVVAQVALSLVLLGTGGLVVRSFERLCRLLFVRVILGHEHRRVVRVAVTEHPTATWTAQQLREAFPWDRAPRYVVHDRDAAFADWAHTAKAIGIDEVLTAPPS